MKKKNVPVWALLMALASGTVASGQVRFNEVMQSNIDGLFVENEFPDSWIELKNTSEESIDLKGWRIGTKDLYESAYIIPQSCIVAPGEYVLIYCDKEGRGLHTDFRVDSGKGMLKLWDSDGRAVETVTLAKFRAPEVSCGVSSSGKWEYFITPTPGADNVSATSSRLLPEPTFSPSAGIYSAGLAVTIKSPSGLPDDALLCVTTDGREPTEKDAVKGLSHTVEISSSTPLRAKYISKSALSRRSTTKTYIVEDRELTLPVVCLTTDPDFLYDEEMGMLAGDETQAKPNYRQTWRRPMQIEYFELDGDAHKGVINQQGEAAVMGNSSRKWPQKSLKLYSHKRFGTKNFAHTFWADKPNVKTVPSFMIRNAGNNFNGSHIKDSFLQTLFGENAENIDYQAYQPVIAYINGEYYGLIDLRERSNEDFLESNYPALDSYYMVEDWWEGKTPGSTTEFFKFERLFRNPESDYDDIAAYMDMRSLAVQYLADSFGFNVDTPRVNKIVWSPAGDVKWRWLLKDMDNTAFGSLVTKNYASYLRLEMKEDEAWQDWYSVNEKSAELFVRCLSFPKFHNMCADLFIAFNGDFLRPDRVVDKIDAMAAEIAPEWPYFVEKYNITTDRDVYTQDMRDFYSRRGEWMLKHFRDELKFGEPVNLTVDINHTIDSGDVRINGHRLRFNDFSGTAFADHAVEISCETGRKFDVIAKDADGSEATLCSDMSFYSLLPEEGKEYSVKVMKGLGVESAISSSEIRVYNYGRTLIVENAPLNSDVRIFTPDGKKVALMKADSERLEFDMNAPGIYIVSIPLHGAYKVVAGN